MKFENQKQFAVFIVLITILTLGLIQIVSNMSISDHINVTFIGQSKYSYEYRMTLEGAKLAANEYGIELQSFAPDNKLDVNNQIELVEMAINNKTDAIIIAPIDERKLNESLLKAQSQGIIVIGLMTDRDLFNYNHIIISDYYHIGEKMADNTANALFEKRNGGEGPYKVVVINSLNQSKAIYQIQQGFLDKSESYKALYEIVQKTSYEDPYLTSIVVMDYLNKKSVKAVVALNGVSTDGVALAMDRYEEMKKEAFSKDKFFTISFNDTQESLIYIESGQFDEIIVENMYSMGYLAVDKTIQEINNEYPSKDKILNAVILNEESINDEQVQKIVFIVE